MSTRRTASPGAGSAPRASTAANAWNRRLSWTLVFGIAPHVPLFLLEPLHHATTLLCFATMTRQRRAACRNLRQVTGHGRWASYFDAYRLFLSFSRVIVAHARLQHSSLAEIERCVRGGPEVARVMNELLAEGRGLIVVTAHLGHWDVGMRLLVRMGRKVHVVMKHAGDPGAERFAQKFRDVEGVRVHELDESPLLALDLLEALGRGEIVTVQVDRPAGSAVEEVPFFGRLAPLPAGPVHLAMATRAPVLPVFTLLDGWRSFRLVAGEPMRFRKVRGPGAAEAVKDAMRQIALSVEKVVRAHPRQWFNFHDVWPEAAVERGGA